MLLVTILSVFKSVLISIGVVSFIYFLIDQFFIKKRVNNLVIDYQRRISSLERAKRELHIKEDEQENLIRGYKSLIEQLEDDLNKFKSEPDRTGVSYKDLAYKCHYLANDLAVCKSKIKQLSVERDMYLDSCNKYNKLQFHLIKANTLNEEYINALESQIEAMTTDTNVVNSEKYQRLLELVKGKDEAA